MRNHHDWFDFTGDRLQRATDIYNSGYLKVMKERDSEGRRVLVCNNDLDMGEFDADDVFRLHCMVIMLLSFVEEKTQLCGAVYIDLFTGISMKYMLMYPLKSIYEFTVQLKMTPIRMKQICLVGLPSFATQVLHIIKLALSDVMSKRFQVFDEISQLWNVVEQNVMTKDYGGMSDEQEVIEDFRKIIDERLDEIREFLDFEMDLAMAGALKNNHENVGSFRKLEID